jgi:hypothetical protein
VALPRYIPVGTLVEANRNGTWVSAKIDRHDPDDDDLPYGVIFADTGDFRWSLVGDIRELTPERPKVLQYSVRTGTSWSAWYPLERGKVLALSTSNNAFQVREVEQHTDAEIVAKLRERGSYLTIADVRKFLALGGNS